MKEDLETFERIAKENEFLCKPLFLQHLYMCSDESAIEDKSLDLILMVFIHENLSDMLPIRE